MMNGDIMQAENNQKLRDWPENCAIDGNSIEEKS